MRTLGRILALYRPYRGRLVLSQVLLTLSVVCTLGTAFLNQRLVNDGLLAKNTDVVIETGIWMAVLAVLSGVLITGTALIAVFFSQGTAYAMRTMLYERVQTFTFGNFDRFRTGNLLVRLSSDVTNVTNAVLYAVLLLLYAPIMIIVALALVLIATPSLAWVLVVVAVVVLGASWVVIPPMERAYEQRQARLDEVNNTMQENLTGVRVVKAFVREDSEMRKYATRTDELRVPAFAAAFRVALLNPLLQTITQLGIVLALFVGGTQVAEATGMTVGQVTAFTQYLALVVVPLGLLALITPFILRGLTSASRIFEVVDAEPELTGPEPGPDPVAVPTTGGARIAFEGASFAFVEADGSFGPDVVDDLDLVIEPGQRLGILGATGSGKTALVNLIPRFYDVRAGRVTIDGVDVREIPLADLRAGVGIALQEAVLFQGNLRENLVFAQPTASDDRIHDAARAADAYDFVEALPQRLESPVERRGNNFSGGQRQRLSMTRALVPRPRVVILDDSTSALDVATESRVQEEIPRFVEGATTIYVAQRISAVIDLDRIVLLDRGRIVAQGSHDALLRTSPLYREIYQSQLGPPPVPLDGSGPAGSAGEGVDR